MSLVQHHGFAITCQGAVISEMKYARTEAMNDLLPYITFGQAHEVKLLFWIVSGFVDDPADDVAVENR